MIEGPKDRFEDLRKFASACEAKRKSPFSWWKREERANWMMTAFGLRVHYCRSYGGIFV